MAECVFHPSTETNVRCVECDRPICPEDFVTTPVGYKCKDCARQLTSARRTVKPRQLIVASLAALAVGIGGALAAQALGLGFWVISIVLGVLTGEAARKASGGHRDKPIAAVAGASALLGTYLGGFGLLSMVLAAAAATGHVASNRW